MNGLWENSTSKNHVSFTADIFLHISTIGKMHMNIIELLEYTPYISLDNLGLENYTKDYLFQVPWHQ